MGLEGAVAEADVVGGNQVKWAAQVVVATEVKVAAFAIEALENEGAVAGQGGGTADSAPSEDVDDGFKAATVEGRQPELVGFAQVAVAGQIDKSEVLNVESKTVVRASDVAGAVEAEGGGLYPGFAAADAETGVGEGDGANTGLAVDIDGAADFADPDVALVLEGVDLVGTAPSQAALIDDLLATGQVEVV